MAFYKVFKKIILHALVLCLEVPKNYKIFLKLILSPSLTVVSVLCEITSEISRDILVQALVPLFENQHQFVRLLRKVSKKELGNCDSITIFLKGGGVTSKMMGAYAKLVGGDYLRKVMEPVAHRVAELTEPPELDINKLPLTLDLKAQLVLITQNMQKLNTLATFIIDTITKSAHLLPPTFNLVCRELTILASHYFRFDSKDLVITSFIFNQLICPGIVSPKYFGIREDANTSRTLIMLSRLLSSAAHGKLFPQDDYMSVMNVFIEASKPKIEAFYDSVLKRDIPSNCSSGISIPPADLQKSLHTLITLLEEKRADIAKGMSIV